MPKWEQFLNEDDDTFTPIERIKRKKPKDSDSETDNLKRKERKLHERRQLEDRDEMQSSRR